MQPYFRTKWGRAYHSSIEHFLIDRSAQTLKDKTNLIFTSPPFPLQNPKKYGNLRGQDYVQWLANVVEQLVPFLTPDGSLVIEIGNAWNKGEPTMSIVPMETLITLARMTDLTLCQQFVWHNSAKLPGPAEWVTKKRVRVTDSFTHIWWFAKGANPKANNRNVLTPYSEGMKTLLRRQTYNSGSRPSGHAISRQGFLTDNQGSIPRSFLDDSDMLHDATASLVSANTTTDAKYRAWCQERNLHLHPATMAPQVVDFFIRFLTESGDLVFDPFGGSCVTGYVAQSLERRWICVEPTKDYLAGARGRFAG